MEHKLESSKHVETSITVKEIETLVEIIVSNFQNVESIILTKKELHSFIGVLLHVQQKMK